MPAVWLHVMDIYIYQIIQITMRGLSPMWEVALVKNIRQAELLIYIVKCLMSFNVTNRTVNQSYSSILPYVAKCSRSIIFANFANGAHSRILLFANFMLHIHGIYICVCTIYYNRDIYYDYNYGDVALRWRTSMVAICLVKPCSGRSSMES